MVIGAAALMAAVVVLVAVVAARDMDRRGRSGEVYAIAILFVLPLGLLMWALDRRPPAKSASTDEAPPEDAPPEDAPPDETTADEARAEVVAEFIEPGEAGAQLHRGGDP